MNEQPIRSFSYLLKQSIIVCFENYVVHSIQIFIEVCFPETIGPRQINLNWIVLKNVCLFALLGIDNFGLWQLIKNLQYAWLNVWTFDFIITDWRLNVSYFAILEKGYTDKKRWDCTNQFFSISQQKFKISQ